MIRASTPVSSSSSRSAASSRLSPASTRPPGSEKAPAEGGAVRLARSTRPPRKTAMLTPSSGYGGSNRLIGSWIEALLFPAFSEASEPHAVVQPERPVRPEFDRYRPDAVADPIGGARHAPERKFGGVFGHRRLQRQAIFERARLLARPSADTALQRARAEIGVGLGFARQFDGAANPHLAGKRFPVEDRRRLHIGGKLASFVALGIAIENKAVGIKRLEKYHAYVWHAFGIRGSQSHRIGIARFGFFRRREPVREEREGFVGIREVMHGYAICPRLSRSRDGGLGLL